MTTKPIAAAGLPRRTVLKHALSTLAGAALTACGGGGEAGETAEGNPQFSIEGLDQLATGVPGAVTIRNSSPVSSGEWSLLVPTGLMITPSSGPPVPSGAAVTVQATPVRGGTFTLTARLAGGSVEQVVSFTVAEPTGGGSEPPVPEPSAVPTSAAPPQWMTAAIGEWAQIPGTTAPREVREYSGIGVRDDGTGVEIFSALGGGHAGNATNNRVMTLQLAKDKPIWIERMPASDPTGTSINNPVDAFFQSDSHPTPRHTYVDINWIPALGVYLVGGEAGGKDGTGSFKYHVGFRPSGDTGGDWDPPNTYPDRPDYRWNISAFNPATGEYYALHNTMAPNFYKFDSRATPPTWTRGVLKGTTTAVARGGVAFDTKRGKLYQLGGGAWFVQAPGYRSVQIDPSTGDMVDIQFNGSAAWTDFQANSGRFVGSALTYNPDEDCFYFYNGNTGNPVLSGQTSKVYKVIPNDSRVWDMEILATTGVVPGTELAGVYNKFFYVSRWRALILVVGNENVYYLRTASSFQSIVQITSGSRSGALNYSATVLPRRGEIPRGLTLVSDDTPTLRASIVSTHDDGSAAIVVVGGSVTMEANATRWIGVRAAATTDSAPALAATHVGTLVNEVAVNFSGSYGSARLTNFGNPEHVWWSNQRVICARYRLQAPTPGGTALEAVIDITAYDGSPGRALVEVVVENGRIDALNSTKNGKPVDADYSGATVSVNGTVLATVSSSANPRGTHQCFRAWYTKGWVGTDPEVRATQHHQHLQRHPLFWRCLRESSVDMSIYAGDTYTPWSTGRHRVQNMGGTGDHDSIGPLPLWESRALQSGDRRCWQATEASALAVLSYDVNYRDTTGFVPDGTRMPGKFDQSDGGGNWPMATHDNAWATWEAAHQPAAGLMAFVGRPSPVFIEIAQKIAVWTGTRNNSPSRLTLFDSAAVGLTDMTGITPLGQARAFGWGMRNTTHATFLSPDGSSWRSGGRLWLGRIARMGASFQRSPYATLNLIWDSGPGVVTADHRTDMPGKQIGPWAFHFVVGEAHKTASVRLCEGEDQDYMESFADWVARQPARWVNEQPNGGWRFCSYSISYLDASGNPFATYAAQRAYDIRGSGPSSVRGGWGAYPTNQTSWVELEANGVDDLAGANFNDQFWYALVAAVERDVDGAAQAWETVSNGITNLSDWVVGYGTQPRWGAYPRNL